jgi:hypothetical protein
MYNASIIAYFPHSELPCFITNRKIPDLESQEENMSKWMDFEPGKIAEGFV